MITANVIHRVFRMRYGDRRGTAFTLDVESRQYLVTAKHLVHDMPRDTDIGLFGNSEWHPLTVKLVGHCRDGVDISILSPSSRLTPPNLHLDANSDGAIYGQDVYFLGFPYDYVSRIAFTDRGYPLPFVKKATLSLFDKELFLLDGQNNPGFSGGPVVFQSINEGNRLKVAAVISGYRAVHEPVFLGEEQTPLAYRYNTGIIVSYSINEALAVVAASPTGLVLD